MTSDDFQEVRAMEIRFLSDVGKKRNTNQDYADVYYNQANYPLAILADGMGGHQAGDVASKKAVEELGAAWQASEITDPEKCAQWLIQQIQIENQAIFEMGAGAVELAGMGTTIVAVAIFEDQFTIAHVGDSRIYLLRSGKLQQLTEDHSLVNEVVKSGEITQEQAANHPRKNVLLRSVGMPGVVEVDVASFYLQSRDYLVLCSDGLTNMVSDAEIANTILFAENLEEALQSLVQKANDAGGLDNITAVVISLGGERDAD